MVSPLPPSGHHTVYIGVHVPKSYQRRRRHRRKSSHKERKERPVENVEGDKTDGENADEAAPNILKPLSELWQERLHYPACISTSKNKEWIDLWIFQLLGSK